MKKYIAIFVLLLTCQVGYSQKYSVDALFKEFADTKNSEKVKIGGLMMSFAGMFTETMGVKGVEVYAFDECDQKVKDKFNKAIRNLNDSSYETMISSNDENGRTKVLVKIEDDIIHELIVISSGNSAALVRVKGKIKPSDIERIAQKHGKGGC